jgi:hypothetical protein
MEGSTGSQDLGQLRSFGAALGRLGVPWLLTVFGLSGLTAESVEVLPLLWFAAPVLLWRLWRATQVAPTTARPWLLAGTAIGLCCWVVAVPASLLGAAAVTRSAHWIGTWLGLVLYSTALARLTRSLAWPAYERRWLQASRTALLAGITAAVGSAVLLVAALLDLTEQTPAEVLGWVVLLLALAIHLAALIRTGRIHTPTHAALASIPTTSHDGPFSVGTGSAVDSRPSGDSGPIQQQ